MKIFTEGFSDSDLDLSFIVTKEINRWLLLALNTIDESADFEDCVDDMNSCHTLGGFIKTFAHYICDTIANSDFNYEDKCACLFDYTNTRFGLDSDSFGEFVNFLNKLGKEVNINSEAIYDSYESMVYSACYNYIINNFDDAFYNVYSEFGDAIEDKYLELKGE